MKAQAGWLSDPIYLERFFTVDAEILRSPIERGKKDKD
jgi:hypothetical protein